VLALELTHSYAHTSNHNNFLPYSLKGADMSFYNAASALGLKCLVVPMIIMGWSDDEDEQTLVIKDKFLRFNASGRGDFEVDEYEWGETTNWGYEMPQN